MKLKQCDLTGFHSALVRDCFRTDISIEQAMAVFTVLHACKLRLRYPAVIGHPNLFVLDPITTRDCAEALASIWRDVPGSVFTESYFYQYWNTEWIGYARLEEVSPNDSDLALQVKEMFELHPAIAEIVPDDWNPFVPTPATPLQ